MRRVLLCLVLAAAGSAHAQDAPRGNDGPPAVSTSAPKAEGEYGGVQPGQAKKPDGKKTKKPPKGTLSWIGFEAKNGGSDVFLQSAAPFEVSQRIDNGVLVVSLAGVSRLGSNTWRPIDTRYFDTSLSRITARKKGKGVEVRIAFKNAKDAAQASVRTATEADGMYYVYLSFTGGSPPPESSTTKPAEPEK